MICPECGGNGYVEWTGIIGYATRDMAMDAQDMSLEGSPVYGPCRDECELCEGTGLIDSQKGGGDGR